MLKLILTIPVFFRLAFSDTVNQVKETPKKNIKLGEIFSEFEKPKGVLFKLDEVEIADSFLGVDSARKIFESKLGKQILFFPKEQENFGLLHCPNNGIIQTVQECYDNHRPLILSPDVVWLAICQGVSIHINENFDSLKKSIFLKNKPDAIVIRNDSLEFSEKHWKKLIESFSTETKKYTKGDFYSFFVPEFSTTTQINKTAYQITMLESIKKGFEYVGESGCGIPSILITGETKDWEHIYNQLDLLNKIGLSRWVINLKQVIQEFINASKNTINKAFWKDIYKNASEYNAFYISGWITKFFPYIKVLDSVGVDEKKNGEMRFDENLVPNPFMYGDDYQLSTLSTDNFPTGISKVTVVWNNYLKDYSKKIEVYSGFFAIKQYKDKSLEPFISYAICDEKSKEILFDIPEKRNRNLKHRHEYWSPHFADVLQDSAVYEIKKFKSQRRSISFVREVLLDSLKHNKSIQEQDYLNDTLLVEIFSNGKIGKVTLQRSSNKTLEIFCSRILKRLPGQWFPALTHPKYILELMDEAVEDANLKVRVNSKIKIGL
ncbi:MAG: DUF4419 domain-containing protein [Sphingobacteriia bacterium]|nr:MAG: DUF4419 domain-containing protein [Sphingobacteriia bacterium]